MVTFEVGPEKKIFLIHKEFACRASPVFEKAFNSIFEEGRTQIYKLPDVTPGAFGFFSEWIYSQRLSLLNHDFAKKDSWSEEEKANHVHKCLVQDDVLVNLWVMRDRYLVKGLQNHVIGQMMEIRQRCGYLSRQCSHEIYKKTMSGSPLRRIVVDQYAWSGTRDEYTADLPHEMLADLVILYSQSAPRSVKERMIRDAVAEEYFVTEPES